MHPGTRSSLLIAALIVAAACVVYVNSFGVPFVFDDVPSIVGNDSIRQLWPPWGMLNPPSDWGFTVSGRPLLNVSFAVNYAISEHEVWSYHAINLVIHALAGLCLFGLIRRTLLQPVMRDKLGEVATPLAAIVALVWTVHPLQTESVTYIVQRAESMMGLFSLASLYAVIRSLTPGGVDRRWWALAWLSCLLSVASKEVAALIPVMAFLYDRTFVSGSFGGSWRRHRWVHLSLALTWLPLGWLVASTGGDRGGTMGFDLGIEWVGYWLTQFEAVTRYLWLSFWPHPLVFDYGKVPPPTLVVASLWAIPVIALVVATVLALKRWPVAGFLGAWFFAILAPTSIVPGGNQMIVEHRMYLPLAAVVAGAFGLIALRLGRKALIGAGVIATFALGAVTLHRNTIYQDEQLLWEDTLAKRPDSARAHNNLGRLLYDEDRLEEAIARYRRSLELDPTIAHTYYNLGLALMKSGRTEEALEPLREAIRLIPYYFNAHLNLGISLAGLNRLEEALHHYGEAVRYDANPVEGLFRSGVAHAALGQWREAMVQYTAALQLDPDHVQARSNLGVALFQVGEVPAAIARFREVLSKDPGVADVHFNLGLALSTQGNPTEARQHYEEAVRLAPTHALARLNLGVTLAQAGDVSAASTHFLEAARLAPESAEAHLNLAMALAYLGRPAEALTHYQRITELRPADAMARVNLGNALAAVGRREDARAQAEEALRLQSDFPPAAELLRRLQ